MTAILLDIDGVLHVSGEAVPGAPEAVQALRDKGHRLRFVTNNTTRARGALAGELQAIGFDLESEDITTTPLAAGKLLLVGQLGQHGGADLKLTQQRSHVTLQARAAAGQYHVMS